MIRRRRAIALWALALVVALLVLVGEGNDWQAHHIAAVLVVWLAAWRINHHADRLEVAR